MRKAVIYWIAMVLFAYTTAFSGTFTDNSDGTITDSSTDLIWQQASTSGKTWAAALQTCNSLKFPANTTHQWRLPNVKEAYSIVDFTKVNPAMTDDGKSKFSEPTKTYWTSTIDPKNAADKRYYLNYGDGTLTSGDKDSGCWVRCVRGGKKR